MGRTLSATVCGFMLWAILWTVGGQIIMAVAPGSLTEDWATDSTGVMILLIVVAGLASILAGFAAAKVARDSAMNAAWILAAALTTVALAVEIEGWEKAAAWYHIALLAILTPGVLIGAKAGAGRPS